MCTITNNPSQGMGSVITQAYQRNAAPKMMANSAKASSGYYSVAVNTHISKMLPEKASKWELSRTTHKDGVLKQLSALSDRVASKWERSRDKHQTEILTRLNKLSDQAATKWELSQDKHQGDVLKQLSELSDKAATKWELSRNKHQNEVLKRLNYLSNKSATKWKKSRDAHQVEVLARLNALPLEQSSSKNHSCQHKKAQDIQKPVVTPTQKRAKRTPISRWNDADLQRIKQHSVRMYRLIRHP
ncbi:hypothetical protein [uncultured Endozoicomonas sp.]|uniref:hypothetical protein n=1 Tax=uncultured Endozoicomonas sp. TaxID=432652 RepID=UPI00260B8F02|nr:hypothetical protein [uncultured Endozoicomonas sp.]